MQFVIVREFEQSSLSLTEKNLNMLTTSVFQTVKAVMNIGDSAMIKVAIEESGKIKGVDSLELYRSKATSEAFGLDFKPIEDELIKKQFKTPKAENLNLQTENSHKLRLIRPLIAEESCLACHANSQKGDVLGVMDLYYSFDEIDADLSNRAAKFVIIFIIAIVITAIFLLLALNYIVKRPIEDLLDRATDLSSKEANLKARVNVKSSDEVGEVGKKINKFIEKIQNMVCLSQEISKSVEETGLFLGNNANELNSCSKEQRIHVQSSLELAKNVENELESSEHLVLEVAEKNQDSFSVLNNMLADLSNVVQNIEQSNEKEQELVQKISEISSQAQDIRGIVEIIKDISEQINLLSLNAAIEAARAGEHGRGFNVVAQEIGALAYRTQKSLADINATINAIVQSIAELINYMEENAKGISGLSFNAQNLMQKASNTKDSMKDSIELAKQSAQKSVNLVDVTKELLESMQETMKISDKNQFIAQELVLASDKLNQASAHLKSELEKFKT